MSFGKPTTMGSAAPADTVLPADAADTISSVSWSPAANHLAAASWDGKVRIYDVASGPSAHAAAMLSVDSPVLSCDWAKDGTMVLAGGADKKPHLLHLATGQQAAIGSHDAPIRSVRFLDTTTLGASPPAHLFATGSWDKTVNAPTASTPWIPIIATAERKIHLVDLRNPSVFLRTSDSPLKHQTRAVSVFPDGRGWATTSIEGRCGINAVDEPRDGKRYCRIIFSLSPNVRTQTTGTRLLSTNFTFRCHRSAPDYNKTTKVYAVNDVQFHPVHTATFVTAGSDGSFHFWDRVTHTPAITTTAFNRDGSLFAYAVGYDWSKGDAANLPDYPNRLVLHSVTDEDVKPRGGNRLEIAWEEAYLGGRGRRLYGLRKAREVHT
ncbi:WD40 repeat-like protein [Apiospora arundinis]